MKKKIFLLFFLLYGSFSYGQEKTKSKLADSYFAQYSYSEALTIYESLASKYPDNFQYVSRTAQCYRFTGNTQKAEEWYAKLVKTEKTDPVYILYYAEMLEVNRKYEEAKKYYEKYKEKNPSDSRASNKLNTIEQLPLFYKDSSFYRVTNLSINSLGSDFGFFPFGGERFVFASNRAHVSHEGKQKYLDLYRVNRNTDGTFDPVQPIWGDVNSQYNEGPIFFDVPNSIFYITTNNTYKKNSQKSKDRINKLKIYTAHFDGSSINGIFDFDYNNSEYSVGYATVSKDGQHLYFVSDMPGGMGGTDIYVCTKESGNWGKPKNLGKKINTEGNEMFPFIWDNDVLYFSSDGFSGLGGLDIYSVKMESGELQTPKNMGYPINSSRDDFSFYLSSDNNNGFFSSNREGGKGDDDIYSFVLVRQLKTEIHGIVRNVENETPVPDAKVVLQRFDGKSVEKFADTEGKFSFEVDWDMDYSISVSKERFINAKKLISTSASKAPFEVEIKIKRSEFNLDAKVINRDSKALISGAKITIATNRERQTILSDAQGSFSFGLESASVYEITIEKSKCMTKTFVISTLDLSPGTIKKTFPLEEFKPGNIFEIKNIKYNLSKSDVQDEDKPELDKLVAIMKENPTLEIELGSHTDSRGDDEVNMVLSDQCAKAAAAYIVSKGIAQRRIVGKGYGETMPLNNCKNGAKCSDAEFEVNRRTEIRILKI